MSSEFVGKFKKKKSIIHPLSSDISNLTCIANDFGYENVFPDNLKALAQPRSFSLFKHLCNSQNIINCIKAAKKGILKVFYLQETEEKQKI